MKLTNTTRMTIDVASKSTDGADASQSIPPGETRTLTGVDKDHPSFKAHLAAQNLVEGKVTADKAPAGARVAEKLDRT